MKHHTDEEIERRDMVEAALLLANTHRTDGGTALDVLAAEVYRLREQSKADREAREKAERDHPETWACRADRDHWKAIYEKAESELSCLRKERDEAKDMASSWGRETALLKARIDTLEASLEESLNWVAHYNQLNEIDTLKADVKRKDEALEEIEEITSSGEPFAGDEVWRLSSAALSLRPREAEGEYMTTHYQGCPGHNDPLWNGLCNCPQSRAPDKPCCAKARAEAFMEAAKMVGPTTGVVSKNKLYEAARAAQAGEEPT